MTSSTVRRINNLVEVKHYVVSQTGGLMPCFACEPTPGSRCPRNAPLAADPSEQAQSLPLSADFPFSGLEKPPQMADNRIRHASCMLLLPPLLGSYFAFQT
jgi:hypothetical protein